MGRMSFEGLYKYINSWSISSMDQRALYENIICKFLLNLPKQQLDDSSRLSHHIEKAFYFYIDEILQLKELKDWEQQRNQFINKLRQNSPASFKIHAQTITQKIHQNKPVCGAIILNTQETKCLMIKNKGKLGFPKGKWNQFESAQDCAIRQVLQQTGINISNKLDSRIKIEFDTHGSTSYFFVARGVSEQERVKIDAKQVQQIKWINISQLKDHEVPLVQKSKIAWNILYKDYLKKDKSSAYVSKYSKKDHEVFDYNLSPLLLFRLDRVRLHAAFFAQKQ